MAGAVNAALQAFAAEQGAEKRQQATFDQNEKVVNERRQNDELLSIQPGITQLLDGQFITTDEGSAMKTRDDLRRFQDSTRGAQNAVQIAIGIMENQRARAEIPLATKEGGDTPGAIAFQEGAERLTAAIEGLPDDLPSCSPLVRPGQRPGVSVWAGPATGGC